VPSGFLEVELAPGGRDCCSAYVYGVCGLRAARGAGGFAWGVVLGCGFCAAVEAYMA
jgi:hypothetical protein